MRTTTTVLVLLLAWLWLGATVVGVDDEESEDLVPVVP
jgi:hypothetical protein